MRIISHLLRLRRRMLTPAARAWPPVCVLGLLVGCASAPPLPDAFAQQQQRDADVLMAADIADDSAAAAVITQHTLFPHHFVTGAAELNDLGRRDLVFLTDHFRQHPGPLSVRQGTASDELYAARVQTVNAALRQGHLEPGRATIVDALPGGRGIRSDDVMYDFVRLRQSPQVEQTVPTVRPATAR